MFKKEDWHNAVRQWPTSTIIGAALGALATWIAKVIGIPALDQLEWPALTGLGYLIIFFTSSFLFVALLASARWVTGGVELPINLLNRWRDQRARSPASGASPATAGLPLSVTLSNSYFSNYAGFFREGMRSVTVTLPSGESTVKSDESIDEQVFVVEADITNLSEKRMILGMRLVITRHKDGRKFGIKAGRRGSWGLLMGEHDAGSRALKEKNMPVPAYLDFPLTIEPHSNVVGKIAFISQLPRDMLLKDWIIHTTNNVEITDTLSGKSIRMPTTGIYRGS
jgi:hypothetical protein